MSVATATSSTPAGAENAAPPLLVAPSGRRVPPLILGTSSLGSIDPTGTFGLRERRRVWKLLDEVTSLGLGALDLARSYRAGGAERAVGEWMAGSGAREELVLVTKAGHPSPVLGRPRLDADSLEADLDASLDALGVDAVDLLLLHRDDPDVELSALARTLAGFVSSGRARRTGVSNWSFDRIEALDEAAPTRVVHASSPQLSLAEWRRPAWKGCWSISGRKRRYERRQYARAGLPTLAYCPLGQGFLTEPRGDLFGVLRRGVFSQEVNAKRRERVRRLARERRVSPAQIALAYLRALPFPVYPVVGSSSARHVRANLEALRVELDPSDVRWLELGDADPLADEENGTHASA